MQQPKYKIQPLVEKGFDFRTIFPDKQNIVKEMSGYDFSIPEIVKFIKVQTNNFQEDNLVAFDLDDTIYKLYVKSTGGEKPAEAPATPPASSSKEELQARLRTLKKMAEKKPKDDELKSRIRTMEKRISKMADGGAVAYAGGGLFGDSRYNTGRSWTLDHNQHNKKEAYEVPMKKRAKKYFLGGGVGDIPVSEDRYEEMRGAVPPIYINSIDGHGVTNGFAVGEAYSHEATPDGFKAVYTAFYTFGDKYYQVADLVYFTAKGTAKTIQMSSEYKKGGDVKIGDEPPIIRQVFEDTEELDYAKGGMTKHGIMIGDEVLEDLNKNPRRGLPNSIIVRNKYEAENNLGDSYHTIDLQKGERYAKGGGVGKINEALNELEDFKKTKLSYIEERLEELGYTKKNSKYDEYLNSLENTYLTAKKIISSGLVDNPNEQIRYSYKIGKDGYAEGSVLLNSSLVWKDDKNVDEWDEERKKYGSAASKGSFIAGKIGSMTEPILGRKLSSDLGFTYYGDFYGSKFKKGGGVGKKQTIMFEYKGKKHKFSFTPDEPDEWTAFESHGMTFDVHYDADYGHIVVYLDGNYDKTIYKKDIPKTDLHEYAKGGGVGKKYQPIVNALVKNHGFSKEKAEEILYRHMDVVEMNEGESPATIALYIEEAYNQEYRRGGNISDRTKYLSKRDIDHIETKSGKVIKGSQVVDGAYVKKKR